MKHARLLGPVLLLCLWVKTAPAHDPCKHPVCKRGDLKEYFTSRGIAFSLKWDQKNGPGLAQKILRHTQVWPLAEGDCSIHLLIFKAAPNDLPIKNISISLSLSLSLALSVSLRLFQHLQLETSPHQEEVFCGLVIVSRLQALLFQTEAEIRQ